MINRIRSSRRGSALSLALVIVLLAAAAWFALVAPKRNDAAKLKNDVADAQVKLAEVTQSSAKTKRETAAAALRALPADADQPGLLDQLNALGKKSKVVVTTVTPALTTTTPGALSLSITGDGVCTSTSATSSTTFAPRRGSVRTTCSRRAGCTTSSR